MMTGGDTSFGDSQWPILTASDEEPVEPEDPSTTTPTTAPTQAPTLPAGGELEQGEIYKIINNVTYLTGWAGYVDASGTLVEVSGEGECLVEGAYGRCAYLNENISGETAVVAEVTMSKTFKVGAIEITGDRNTQLDPTNFEIQAYINGTWTTVQTVTNAFTGSPRTVRYTFGPVETNKIRLYITSHEGSYCSIGEIELYEVTTGNIANKIDLSDANVTADSGVTASGSLTSAVVGSVTDGDKSTIVTFNSNYPTIAIDLTNADGTPTNISAFSLFGNRSGNRPTSVEVQIQTTNGGSYVSVGTYNFSANTATSYPFAPYYTELGASYDAYGVKIIVKSLNYAETAGCALAEIELYGSGEAVDTPTDPTEPTTPAETEPTTPAATEPAEDTMQKIDLTNSVVGCDSQDSATQSDYTKLTWYSTITPGWRDLTYFTDGDYTNEVHWGLDPHERADVYIDLTANTGAAVAVDQFKLYHSGYRAVGSVYFALILADGTVVENTADLNWQQDVAADPYVYTYDQTYTAIGLYVWQPDNNPTNGIRAAFGEIELYQRAGSSTTDPTEPTTPPATVPTEPTEAPTAPAVPSDPIKQGNVLQIVPASKITTQFGYYSDYSGDDETTFVDCLDGYCVTDGWYGRAGYSECTSADGLIALVMTLDEAKTLGAIELIGKNEENNPKCFDVQAMIDGEWVSVVSRTDDTFVSGLTQAFDFRKTITTSKLRILIYAVVDAKNECYLNEVTLYEATTGNATQTIDLTGKGGINDADPAHPIGDLVDNNKTTEFLGSVATFDLTVDGQATAVDGFNLYAFRADADGRHRLPTVVTVQIEKIHGGEYETIGTFETGWTLNGITDVLTAKFDQTYMAYSIRFTFDSWSYANELELFQYVRETEPTEPDKILVGATYSIHLIEPWALRTSIQFAKNDQNNLIPVSSLTSYGVYAIIGDKFEGATVEELLADPDAVKYTSADGNITAKDATTLTFDFYDGLYSFNLDESIYWVAYFEDADGVHYTSVKEKSLIAVANNLLDKPEVSEAEKAILQSMKKMKDAMTALRGANADLGHIYAAGVANPGTLGDRNTGYLYGTAHQIKLIEPWGIRVRVLMRKNAPVVDGKAVYADYASASDYGLIFFHDKTGKYNGAMTAEQMNTETGAKVFSKLDGSAVINAGGVTAIYDQGIYTHELNTELYCLPYIVIDGQYYYPANAIRWNLLGEMVEFSERKDLDPKETAAFEAILKMYDNVQNHKG
jgi:hypothetical protein